MNKMELKLKDDGSTLIIPKYPVNQLSVINIAFCIAILCFGFSVLYLPSWTSMITLSIILFVYYIKEKKIDGYSEAISILHSVISEKGTLLEQKKEENNKLEETIENQNILIKEQEVLIAELSKKPRDFISRSTEINEILSRDFKTLLKTIQMLDITTQDFGKDCHEYVRREVERAVKKCKMRFEDYNEGTKDFYDIEYVKNRDKILYDTRAIVDNVDNQVVLEGHVFVPRMEK